MPDLSYRDAWKSTMRAGAPRFEPEDIRIALTLKPEVPIVMFDARNRDSVKKVLVSLVRYVLSIRSL